MLEIFKTIAGALITGGASTAGGLTARVAAFAALVAAIAGPAAWLWAHRIDLAAAWNAELVAFTVGQVVTGSAVLGVFVYLVTFLAHRAPPP
jgi:hypothetical protein